MPILNARKRKNTVAHVKEEPLTHLAPTKECFFKLRFPFSHPEMFKKFPFVYNLLWLLLAQGEI